MILPPLHGSLTQSNFFVYAAADSKYFDDYGIPLINSVIRNTDFGVHLHLYNPRQDQIEFCQNTPKVSVTWETVLPDQFDSTIKFWSQSHLPEPYNSRKNKMLGIKTIGQPMPPQETLNDWLYKTYYACMRFVRLAEIINHPQALLSIDVDGLVRKPFEHQLPGDRDFYLYLKEKGGHLAGAILFTERTGSLKFIRTLADMIRREIEQDNIYWFLDQHSLDNIVENYKKGLLPMSYIDWHMDNNSAIWSAKGKRKSRDIFQNELAKYR